ncbi:hypothetical protein OHJ16_03110 [Actinomyces israelii]|uniref:Heparan-alpha-glucosaminide N-acetyltransferase catalytic domain-containing protein n=1 Tax=Actinomyces israelii TaxID=1659 RepID=A0ABT4I6X2_9ACTO|nr:hypothetical protein [Actinomyces israelii]MCZ0857037.1 hypothetical protein [Actinomyces israelii]
MFPHVPPATPDRRVKRPCAEEHAEQQASEPPLSKPASRPAPRYRVLDVLRGFAICGILLVNIGDITELGRNLPYGPRSPSMAENASATWSPPASCRSSPSCSA